MFKFIRKEYIYVLMALVIITANIANYTGAKEGPMRLAQSTMTLKEMGITEARVKDFLNSGKPGAIFFKYFIFLGFFVFFLSMVLNVGLVTRRKKIDFTMVSPAGAVPWGIPDLVRATIVIMFFGYVSGMAQAALLKKFHFKIDKNLGVMAGTFLVDAIAMAVLVYFAALKYGRRISVLGLKFKYALKSVSSGLMSYVAILPALLAVLFLSAWILDMLGYSPPSQPVFDIFIGEKRSNVLLFMTIFVSILGPVVEEVFFRGFMYPAIKKRFGFMAAGLLSAAIFSSLHTNMVGFFPIMILGMLLAYVYEKTNSLAAPIAVHMAHNSIIVAFVFFIKEMMG